MAEELPCFVAGLHSNFGRVIPSRVAKATGWLELIPLAQVQRATKVVAKFLVAAKVEVEA